MKHLTNVCHKIPCCGCFAPTRHPESSSCLRRFSNEHTLPCNCCFMRLRPICETSRCCMTIGKCGVTGGRRDCCLTTACTMTVSSALLLIVALLGATNSPDFVDRFNWAHAKVGKIVALDAVESANDAWHEKCMKPMARVQEEAFVGVRLARFHTRLWISAKHDGASELIGDQKVLGLHEIPFGWSSFGFEIANVTSCSTRWGEEMCKDCGSVMEPVIWLTTLGALLQFPAVVIDLQRSTKFGDVNCVKSLGLALNIIGIVMIITASCLYHHSCYGMLQKDTKFFVDSFGNVADVTAEQRNALYNWIVTGRHDIKADADIRKMIDQLLERLQHKLSNPHDAKKGLILQPTWAIGMGVIALSFALVSKVICFLIHCWIRTPKTRYGKAHATPPGSINTLFEYLHAPYKNTQDCLLNTPWIDETGVDRQCKQTEMVKKQSGFKKPVALRIHEKPSVPTPR